MNAREMVMGLIVDKIVSKFELGFSTSMLVSKLLENVMGKTGILYNPKQKVQLYYMVIIASLYLTMTKLKDRLSISAIKQIYASYRYDSNTKIYNNYMISVIQWYLKEEGFMNVANEHIIGDKFRTIMMKSSKYILEDYGDMYQSNEYHFDLNKISYYHDSRFDVDVGIQWIEDAGTTGGGEKQQEYSFIYPIVYTNSKQIKVLEYIKKIKQYYRNTQNETYVVLRYYSIRFDSVMAYQSILDKDNKLSDNVTSQLFYDKSRKDYLKEDKELILETFFHMEKTAIVNKLKSVHNNDPIYKEIGQIPHANYILHGPPGTGKSSFIRRLAIYLERNIVSVDLSSFMSFNKLMIYFTDAHRHEYSINDTIFVIDELDIHIKKIHEKVMNVFDTVSTTSKDKWYVDQLNERDYEVRDLLGLFQGNVVIPGMIIIATTNKLDYIQEICPELTRDGRLTPVSFGNLNYEYLIKMTKYHYRDSFIKGSELDKYFADHSGQLMTSTITRYIEESKTNNFDDPYKYFEKKVLSI